LGLLSHGNMQRGQAILSKPLRQLKPLKQQQHCAQTMCSGQTGSRSKPMTPTLTTMQYGAPPIIVARAGAYSASALRTIEALSTRLFTRGSRSGRRISFAWKGNALFAPNLACASTRAAVRRCAIKISSSFASEVNAFPMLQGYLSLSAVKAVGQPSWPHAANLLLYIDLGST